MYIGNAFVPRLYLTREKRNEYAKTASIGIILCVLYFVALLAVILTALQHRDEKIFDWLVVPGFTAVAVCAIAMAFLIPFIIISTLYDDWPLHGGVFSKIIFGVSVIGMLVFALLALWVMYVIYPEYARLCREHPSNLLVILSIGTIIEYAVYAGRKLAVLIRDWRHDYRHWREVCASWAFSRVDYASFHSDDVDEGEIWDDAQAELPNFYEFTKRLEDYFSKQNSNSEAS